MKTSGNARLFATILLLVSSAIMLAVSACDAGEGDVNATGSGAVASPQTPVTSTPPGVEARRCSPPRPHEPGDYQETVVSGGLQREFTLHVPTSYTGEGAVPLVLNFHGLGSNAGQQAAFSGLPAKSDEEDFVLVTPQGRGEVPYWSAFEANSADVVFVGVLLDTLEEQLCIDSDRIYSTGLSNGGLMSARLACDLSSRIAAVAPVAGFAMPEECSGGRAVSVVAFHGTDDPILPFDGGPVGLPGIDFTMRSVGDAFADWAVHDGCAREDQEAQIAEHVRRRQYDGCDDGAVVELYVVEGGGHTWPGGTLEAEFLGPTTHEISATDLMWDFFQAHPMP